MSSRVPPRFPADTSLELSAPEMERLVRLATDRIVDHVASLPAQPAADTDGAEALARGLIEREPPETGVPVEELLDLLFTRAIPKSFNSASPGYLAYIPGGGLFPSAVADFVAAATNRYVGVFAAAPALVQLEANVVRWFARIAGFPGVGRRLPRERRLARELLRPRRCTAGPPSRGFPRRRPLRVGPDAPLRRQGRRARRLPGAERPGDPVGRNPSASGSTSSRRRSRRTGRRASRPSSSPATRERRTPARSTTSPLSRTSARGSGSGSTSTPPTADSSS